MIGAALPFVKVRPASAGSDDRVALPPTSRRFASRSGRCVLTIAAVDGWKTPRVAATLTVAESDGPRVRWSQELSQQYGPKFALVADSGAAVLFDEWIHVRTPLAIVVLDRQGRLVARHSTEELRVRLGVPPERMVRAASSGLWMAGQPTWSEGDRFAQVAAAGKTLRIELADGALSVGHGSRSGH